MRDAVDKPENKDDSDLNENAKKDQEVKRLEAVKKYIKNFICDFFKYWDSQTILFAFSKVFHIQIDLSSFEAGELY